MGDDILSNNPASLESTSNDKKVQINHRKILRMKRARIVMTITAIFIVYLILFLSGAYDSTFLICGGISGTLSSIFVLIGLIRHRDILGSHTSLLFWRSVCDLGLGLRFVVTPAFNILLCNSVVCSRSIANVSMCPLQSAICEFFSLTTEAWFLCNGIDLYVSITNPFSVFKDRIFYYHLFSWSVGILFSVAPFIFSNLSFTYGFWYVDGNEDVGAVCWINTGSVSSPIWGMFIVPVLIIYFICVLSLYMAYVRLKLGVTKTFLPRMRLLITNTTNVFILIFYWLVIGVFYMTAFVTQNGGLNRIVMFLLASKGISALFVYFIVVDMNVKLTKENQENVEANIALREEVLNFATAGIRSSTREAHKATADRLKMVRRPKQVVSDDSSKLITPLFFFRFVLGLPMEVAAVENLINANTRRVNPSFHKQIRLSQGQNMQRRSTGSTVSFSANEMPENDTAGGDGDRVRVGRSSSVRLSQRATVVVGGILSNRDVENPLPLPRRRIVPDDSAQAALTGHSLRGSVPSAPRASEMDEVLSDYETPQEGAHAEAYEDDEGEKDADGPKGSTTLMQRLLYYFRAPILDQSDWVEFTEFAPYYFRKIRHSVGVTDDIYIDYFSMTIKERLCEGGASGAFFFFSKGEVFIAKSCTSEELETLKGNAQKYSEYMCANKNSYISKIFGVYRLQIYGNALCFFVMNNIFLNPEKLTMNEKYDIKGSWVNRNAKPPRNGQTATCTYCEQKFVYWKKRTKVGRREDKPSDSLSLFKRTLLPAFQPSPSASPSPSPSPSPSADKAQSGPAATAATALSKSNSSGTIAADNVVIEMSHMGEEGHADIGDISCPYTVNGVHEPNLILKDSDLKYKIRLPYETAIDLLRQLQMDADFLYSLGIMDYSLLVGVHNSEYEVIERSGSLCEASSPSPGAGPSPVSPPPAGPTPGPSPSPGPGPGPGPSESLEDLVSSRKLEVYRVVGPCAYYMGIIDFQQKWNFSKKLERFLKVKFNGADPDGLSAIQPGIYRERFIRKIEDILDFDNLNKPCTSYVRVVQPVLT